MIAAPTAAPGVEHRTVDLELKAPYEGWRFTIRVDFPARVVLDLASGDALKVVEAMDAIVVSHNFPAIDGTVAATMWDVDPFHAVIEAMDTYMTFRGKVPNP